MPCRRDASQQAPDDRQAPGCYHATCSAPRCAACQGSTDTVLCSSLVLLVQHHCNLSQPRFCRHQATFSACQQAPRAHACCEQPPHWSRPSYAARCSSWCSYCAQCSQTRDSQKLLCTAALPRGSCQQAVAQSLRSFVLQEVAGQRPRHDYLSSQLKRSEQLLPCPLAGSRQWCQRASRQLSQQLSRRPPQCRPARASAALCWRAQWQTSAACC